MSAAPRLLLKQPAGWFAAGREVAEALAVLPDGAFRLYVYICLNADRHTGRYVVDAESLARVLRKERASIEDQLGELRCRGVCEWRADVVEIRDRFWPYQKRLAGTMDGPQAEYVRMARAAFLAPACVCSSFTPADEKLAANLYRCGVSLDHLHRAIWLGSARKYIAMLNGHPRTPITSLGYFASLLGEVAQAAVSDSYWGHVRQKTELLEQRWRQTTTPAATPAKRPELPG
jgi:hypothetical protein